MSSPQVIKDSLKKFTGIENFYVFPVTGAACSEGIVVFTRLCNCDWLIQDALLVCDVYKDKAPLITIDYKKSDDHSALIFSEGIIDFPLKKQRLFFCQNTMLLPSEY